MSTTPAAATTGGAPSRIAQAYFAGKIIGKRRLNTESGPLFLTLVKLPAPSEYDSPQTIEVRSSSNLGSINDEFRGWCRVGGYARQYKATDKETGEQTLVRTAEVRLTFID